MTTLDLSNDEKIILSIILDKAEVEVTRERESYLRSKDMESQLGSINALTQRLQFINKMQGYCMVKEVVV